MKTERLYYQDPVCQTFTAHIVEHLTYQDKPAIILDRTAFYPTGGGQPSDRGIINNAQVLDVVEREDGSVIHVLSEAISNKEVTGTIDWNRRFDFMQHHTGQHMLSQACEAIAHAGTRSFHLSEDTATIDVDKKNIPAEQLQQIEALANQRIFEDLPVSTRVVSPAEAKKLPLRKQPTVDSNIRVIEI
ncbi:MAG: alanyl-tRNA editing protein [Nitrospirota bacterium]